MQVGKRGYHWPVLGRLVSFPVLERPVQRGFGDLEGAANFQNWVSFIVEILGNTELFACQGFGSATFASSGSGSC
jgi:hypothetical protein